MPSSLHPFPRALVALAAAALSTFAAAQAPTSGIDLGALTPKTPSQKALDPNATQATTTTKTGIGSQGVGSNAAGATTGGIGAKAPAKTGIGVVGLPGSAGSAKSTPAATDEASASSNDVQVKIPGKK